MPAEPVQESTIDSGICLIRSEYLVKREALPPKETGKAEEDVPDADGPDTPAKRPKLDEKAKKKKNKGQNKGRPVPYKEAIETKLCRVLTSGIETSECTFKKCLFMHDVKKYMERKLPDIGDTCYIFSTKGYCGFGVSCRYAKSHLDENLLNIKSDLFDANALPTTLNQLNGDVVMQLKKRKYDFSKSIEVVKAMEKLRCQLDENNAAKKNPDEQDTKIKDMGFVPDTDLIKERPNEKKTINFREKLFLSPLTTVGNLPFRRICKEYGVDVTCGEMACAVPIINGAPQEWALTKRHKSEDIFGVQLCGSKAILVAYAAQAINENIDVDFIDLNLGCPIDMIYQQGAGSALLRRKNALEVIVRSCATLLDGKPFTVKTRTGIYANKSVAHELVPKFEKWGAHLVTIHGRSREQRYTKSADWNYIEQCAAGAEKIPVFGNGDIYNFEEYLEARKTAPHISGVMIGRGALIKPWIFEEIKEQKHMDISSGERFDMMKKYVNYGLEHWGSDTKGVENTRRFLLEWQSFLYRYVPYGLLEQPPQKLNQRPDQFFGRDDLETLLASHKSSDWIKISEMLLGKVPDNYNFLPKHKANSFNNDNQ